MARRAVLGLVLALTAAILLFFLIAPSTIERRMNRVTMPPEGWPVSESAQALHAELTIGDLHSGMLVWDRAPLRRTDRGHTDLPRLVEGNVAVHVVAANTDSPFGQNYTRNRSNSRDRVSALFITQLRPPRTWFSAMERALEQARVLADAEARAPETLRIIRARPDLDAVLAERELGQPVVGALLAIEGAYLLNGDPANLDRLVEAGFRVVGLVEFLDNELGPSLHGEGYRDYGLTDFGRLMVRRMIDQNLIIDLSHASPATVADVLAIPGARPILSHTGVLSHCPSTRNIADTKLQRIAEAGGLIGIGFWTDVVCGATPAEIAGAIRAAIALVGEDHVALGSNWDGGVTVPFDAAHLPALTQALMDTGLRDEQIRKVMGGNMIRFLSETLPPE
ncbi:dipeptidase [Paracoccus sp. NSM]|uniref:dipeptidase n=1 Tax=Paracoccus sp. NSM TaxID=3457784 RepID=UPI00403539DF